MPRPRFDKLEPERRSALLRIAAEEFAEHGYEAASYNRIIERAGVSKGAIYYYFDDKEDLYATVLRDALQRIIVETGDVGGATDAEGFWRAYEDWYQRSLQLFQDDPHAVGLSRSLVKALSRGAATGVLAELRAFAEGLLAEVVRQGQALGAIRTDLPFELLLAVLMALEEGVDLWLGDHIGDRSPTELARLATTLTELVRRVAEPAPRSPRSPRSTRSRPAKDAARSRTPRTKKGRS